MLPQKTRPPKKKSRRLNCQKKRENVGEKVGRERSVDCQKLGIELLLFCEICFTAIL